MYQFTRICLIGGLILALLFGSMSAANASSDSSSHLLQQSTGTIVIVKDTVPDDPQDFAINLRKASGAAVGGVLMDDDPSDGSVLRQFSRTLEAGTYIAVEDAVIGWNVTAVTCEDPDSGSSGSPANRTATIDLDAGETVTCTFRNEPDPNVPRGTLVIVKDAVPDDPQAFSFSIPGIDSLFSLDDDPGSSSPTNQYSATVAIGTYIAIEQDVSGWNLTALTCSDPDNGSSTNLSAGRATLDIDAGETVTCTFRNEPAALGTIRVIKDAVPDDPQDFAINLRDASGTAAGGFLVDDDPGSTTPNEFSLTREVGTYTAREDAVSGWTLTGLTCDDPDDGSSGDISTRTATIDLDANETVTCTFTNIKDGQQPPTATPTNTLVPTATHTSTATATPTNASASTGTIVIVKDAQPNDPQNFNFVADSNLGGFQLDDDNDSTLSNTKTFTNVTPGTYSVVEDFSVVIGWELTDIQCDDPDNGSSTDLGSGEASIDLDAGETVTCTFTNTKDSQPPTNTPTSTGTPTVTATPSRTPTSPPAGPTCEGFVATIYVNAQGRIVGGPNNGQVYAGQLNGTGGADIMVGTNGIDRIAGKGGNDRICSGGNADKVEGGAGEDQIFGGEGKDELKGGGGNDSLSGEGGNDTLAGGDGKDTLTGGPGADKFNGGAGTDTATDFSSGQGDTKTGVENS